MTMGEGATMSEQFLQQIDELFTRRIGAFAEDVQHKLDLVIEGQQGLGQRLDRVEVILERVEERVTVLEGKVDHLTDRVDAHDARFDQIDARFDQIDAKFAEIDERFDNTDAKIDAVATDLADHRRDTEAHRGYRVSE
jgi:predicted nuclease with TOPRIM domain